MSLTGLNHRVATAPCWALAREMPWLAAIVAIALEAFAFTFSLGNGIHVLFPPLVVFGFLMFFNLSLFLDAVHVNIFWVISLFL